MRDKVTKYCRETVAQRPRDCRATAVDQLASGARQGYGVLSRNDRATPTGLSRNREEERLVLEGEDIVELERENGGRARELETDRAADKENYRKG